MNPPFATLCMLLISTIAAKEIPIVPIDENVETAIYTQWYTEAIGGLAAAVSQDLLTSIPASHQTVHTQCLTQAAGLAEYSSCFAQLFTVAEPGGDSSGREKRQVRFRETETTSNEEVSSNEENEEDDDFAPESTLDNSEQPDDDEYQGNNTLTKATGETAVELLYFARRLLRTISGKNPMDAVEEAHRHPERASQLLAVGDPYDSEVESGRRPLSLRFGLGAMDGLNAAISRAETPKEHLKSEVETWFTYFMRDLSTFSINGSQLNVNSTGRRVLSPTVLGWGGFNDSNIEEVLSPHVLSLVEEPGAIAPLPELHRVFKNTTKRYWLEKILKLSDTLNLTRDLTGGIDNLLDGDYSATRAEANIKNALSGGKVANFARSMKEKAHKDLPTHPPLTKEDYLDFNGQEANETIETFENLYRSLSGGQVHELGTKGFVLMTSEQMQQFYGRIDSKVHPFSLFFIFQSCVKTGAPPFDFEAYANLTREEQLALLNQSMAAIAEADKFEAKRLKQVVATPLVLTPLILTPMVLTPVILSPLVLSPLILSPNVLGPLILSPLVFSPQILSPRVLGPLILSPGVGNPFILSPTVLSPLILSPQVMTPLILSPFVLSPVILSPGVMNPFILSPFVLSPIILSPQALFALVLSPLVASPVI